MAYASATSSRNASQRCGPQASRKRCGMGKGPVSNGHGRLPATYPKSMCAKTRPRSRSMLSEWRSARPRTNAATIEPTQEACSVLEYSKEPTCVAPSACVCACGGSGSGQRSQWR